MRNKNILKILSLLRWEQLIFVFKGFVMCNWYLYCPQSIFRRIILIRLPLYLRMGLLDQWQQCVLQVTLGQLWEVWFVEIASCQREMLLYSFQYSFYCAGSPFDPLGQGRGPIPPLEAKNADRFVQSCIKLFQSINSNEKSTVGRIRISHPCFHIHSHPDSYGTSRSHTLN